MTNEEDGTEISWYHLPFYRSLTVYILFLGAPRNVLIMNAIITFMFVMYFHFFYILIFTVLAHFLCIYLVQEDKQFFDCLSAYMRKDSYYST